MEEDNAVCRADKEYAVIVESAYQCGLASKTDNLTDLETLIDTYQSTVCSSDNEVVCCIAKELDLYLLASFNLNLLLKVCLLWFFLFTEAFNLS